MAQDQRGAVELWQMGRCPDMGGVEIHSPRPLYGEHDEPYEGSCDVLGATCWGDGSSLAFGQRFAPMIRAGESADVLQLLADWHDSQFGAR